jgi:O-succinylbenzoate synthase
MKIEQITLYNVSMPLVAPFETSFGRILNRDCILLEIVADGVTGWGECVADRDPGYAYETTGTAWHILKDFLIPLLIYRDISHPSDVQGLFLPVKGHPMAKAGVEMALWDIYGKQSGLPLVRLFKGERQKVAVGVSVGIQSSPGDLLDTVAGYLQAGYRRIKLKIKPGKDVKYVAAVREAYPEILLQVDANSAYHLDQADLLSELDQWELLLIEQPLAEDDLWDHHLLQKRLATPLCLDESILSPRHARQALEMGACRIINIKAGRVGGLSHSLEIHQYCYERGVPVWCGGMLETGIGRAANLALAALPGFALPGDISATERYYQEDITEQRFVLNPDSTIDVPQQPGLGVDVSRKSLHKYTLEKLTVHLGARQ